jgi:predicted nuclease with TOPRIM domain
MDKQQEIDCLREKCKRHQEEHERACEKMAKQNIVIEELRNELKAVRSEKSSDIHKMWDSLLNVQQIYSNRCKELEKEIIKLRGW